MKKRKSSCSDVIWQCCDDAVLPLSHYELSSILNFDKQFKCLDMNEKQWQALTLTASGDCG